MSEVLKQRLTAYKKKHYLSRTIRNAFLAGLGITGCWYLFSLIEFGLHLNTWGRTAIFLIAVLVATAMVLAGVIMPLLRFWGIGKQISDESVAVKIGNYFPEIRDKLLNTIQLSKYNQKEEPLIPTSLSQRINTLRLMPFTRAIDLRVNQKYVYWFLVSLIPGILSFFLFPGVFVDSMRRIVNFNQEYTPLAPFLLQINNEKLQTFKNEEFMLSVALTGSVRVEKCYIHVKNRRSKLTQVGNDRFEYVFKNLEAALSFRLEAAGYLSGAFVLKVVERPEINAFSIDITYPEYTGKKKETQEGVGNLSIPEGSKVNWNFKSHQENEVLLLFDAEDSLVAKKNSDGFSASKQVIKAARYEVITNNFFGRNKNLMQYEIEVIKDEYPQIEAEFYMDTVLYEYLILAGKIADDYGITGLRGFVGINGEEKEMNLRINNTAREQIFYHRIEIDTLNFDRTKRITAFLTVTDNDRINRFKSTQSQTFVFDIKNGGDMNALAHSKTEKTQEQMNESIKNASKLNEKIKQLKNRLKRRKGVRRQEEKLLEEILKQRAQIEKGIEKLKQDFQQLNDVENKFSKRSEKLREKASLIEQIMDDVLDEETKKLYEEIERLLNENKNAEEIQKKLNELSPNEMDLERELERILELFKRLKLESDIEKTTQELKNLAQEQDELANKTPEKSRNIDSLSNEQEGVQEKFEDIKEKLKNIEKLNQDLKSPKPLRKFRQEQEAVDKNLNNAKEHLKKKDRKRGSESQRKSVQKMKEMSEKMEAMLSGMEMEMIQENIENLRAIVDYLIKISFAEEDLMLEFGTVKQVDPRFIELSQQQIKLKDDAKVIQDSLLALAGRVAQISIFITREVAEMNRNIDDALQQLRERNRNKALSSQQFAMTSINNLSLLLSDLLDQMQQAMAPLSDKGKPNSNKDTELPRLKELQEMLSEQIKELKESGAKGRKLSEQLAKMAAHQEMIRNQLRKFEEQLKGKPGNEEVGKNLREAIEDMEKNEMDLVNKRLSKELIERQKRIETRMLDAEESLKNQGLDEERESESAKDYEQRRPEMLEEYFREKEEKMELLRKVPLKFSPFYKKELNDYFKRISTKD